MQRNVAWLVCAVLAEHPEAFLSKSSALARKVQASRGSTETLNELYLQAQTERDLVHVECAGATEQGQHQLEETRRSQASFGEQVASARADLAGSQANKDESATKVATLEGQLKENSAGCAGAAHERREQHELLQHDLAASRAARDASSCAGTALAQVALLECGDTANSYYSVADVDAHLAEVATKQGRAAVQRALKAAHGAKRKGEQFPKESPFDMELPSSAGTAPAKPMPVAPAYPKRAGGSKCLVTTSAACPVVLDALAQMVGEVEDALARLEEQMGHDQHSCAMLAEQLQAQHEDWTMTASREVANMAKVTARLNAGEEGLRLAREEEHEVMGKYHEDQEACQEKLRQADDNLCQIKHVRAELMALGAGGSAQDCEVGDWDVGACSAECGGGELTMSRPILSKGDGGAPCPPTVLMQSCNAHPCPVDCVMEDWGGWSVCSRDCGGGVEQRTKYTTVQPEHGGRPCQVGQEERQCNVGACEPGCLLTEWAPWSPCSKACGAGVSLRRKKPLPHRDDSQCPGPNDESRVEPQVCNKFACAEGLTCVSALDLVVLLDGSGSIADEDFEAAKSGVAALLERMEVAEEKVAVGAIVFDGEVQQVSALDATGGATGAIAAAARGAKPETFLAPALESAMQLLSMGGRPSAQWVILVFTDGEISDLRTTIQAAERASGDAGARIVVVGIGEMVDLERLGEFASYPAMTNVLGVGSWAGLQDEHEVNRLVADLCPVLDPMPMPFGYEPEEKPMPEMGELALGLAQGQPAPPPALRAGGGLDVESHSDVVAA